MVPNAHCTDPLQEDWTIRGVSIPNEISRRVVPWERLGDLARDPLRRWVCRHAKRHPKSSSVALCHDSNDCLGAIYCNARNHLRIATTVGYHSSSAGWHLRSDNACGGNNRIAKCGACEVGYRLDLSCHYQFALCALVLWGTHKSDLSALKV